MAHKSEFLVSLISTLIRGEIYVFYAYMIWIGAHFIKTDVTNINFNIKYTPGLIFTT